MKIIIVVVIMLVLAVVVGLLYLGQKSSAGTAPGLVEGQLAACPDSPNCVSSEADTPKDKRVEPFSATVWSQIPATISDLGGTVTLQKSDYLSAVFRSSLFKFTDDVEFRLADNVVHVRSASRVGHSDMGANRARVEELRERLGSNQ